MDGLDGSGARDDADGNAAGGRASQHVRADDCPPRPVRLLRKCRGVGHTGALRWGQGIVLRCSGLYHEVVLRVVEVPDARYIDARGAAYLRLFQVVPLVR